MESSRDYKASDAIIGRIAMTHDTLSPPRLHAASDDEAMQRLRASEARYRSLVAATSQIVWTTSADGYALGDMASWCQYTGQTPEEVRGKRILNAIHPDDRGRVSSIWREAINNKQPYEAIYRLRRYDGVYRTFLARGVPVIGEDGSLREWVGTCTDITDHQRMEAQLRESERRFRLTFEQVAVGIAHVAIDGRWLLVNQRLCDIFGYTRDELQALTFQDVTHADDLEQDLAYFRQMLAGEISEYTMEKRYIRKDGTVIWGHLKVSLVRNEQGEADYFISVIEDISARKQAEAEYRQLLMREQAARAYAEAIFETIADGIFVYDAQGHIIQANTAAHELFPTDDKTRSVEEHARSMVMRDGKGKLFSHDELPITRLLRGEVFKGGNALDVILEGRDGRKLYLGVSGAPIYDTEGHVSGAVTVFRDITQRHMLEMRTHEALKGLLNMAEALVQIPDQDECPDRMRTLGMRLAELTCRVLGCRRVGVLTVEPETERILPVAVLGLSPEQEQSWWAEREQQARSLKDSPLLTLVEQLRANQVLIMDMSKPPFCNMPNPWHIKVVMIAPMCVREQLVGLLALDYALHEHHYTEHDIALASAVAKLAGLVFERERLLRERTEAQSRVLALHEANRRMEEFLGIASHELRTPMTTIKANIQLTRRRLVPLTRSSTSEVSSQDARERLLAAQDMLMRADRQVDVLNRLVSDLIDISCIQTGKRQLLLRPELCDLTTIIYETVQEQRKAAPGRTIQFELAADDELVVYADPDRIAQVLTNYMSNALKYSPPDKPVLVQLEKSQSKESGRVAQVLVSDEGPGLPQEELSRVWECFYQVEGIKVQSGSGVGLGLGLYLSKIIIERHGGRVGVYSSQPGGSTFWFTLPLAEDKRQTRPKESPASQVPVHPAVMFADNNQSRNRQ
jgi:PAS domain S-box-containing protein